MEDQVDILYQVEAISNQLGNLEDQLNELNREAVAIRKAAKGLELIVGFAFLVLMAGLGFRLFF